MQRRTDDAEVLVVFQLGDGANGPVALPEGQWGLLFDSADARGADGARSGDGALQLAPRSFVVLERSTV